MTLAILVGRVVITECVHCTDEIMILHQDYTSKDNEYLRAPCDEQLLWLVEETYFCVSSTEKKKSMLQR